MIDQAEPQLNLLLFSVAGILFGAAAEQVEAVNAFNDAEDDDLFWLHKEMGYRNESVVYSSQQILTLRSEGSPAYRVVVDSLEDIVECLTKDIVPFPSLMEPFAVRKGLWGILRWRGTLVFLVDLNRFLAVNSDANSMLNSDLEGETA